MQEFLSRLKLDAIAGNAAEHAAQETLGQLEPMDGNSLPQHFAPLRARSTFDTAGTDVMTAWSFACCVTPMAASVPLPEGHA